MKNAILKLDDIHPYENNPRYNAQAVDALCEHIRQVGFREPLNVDADHVIICGHTRYLAACKLGLKEVPVEIDDDLTPEQAKAYRIADNKLAELSTWDYAKLIVDLKDLQAAEYDIGTLGFASDVLEDLLYHNVEDVIEDGETDPDELPEVTGKIKSKQGEIYALGNHRLMCGHRGDSSAMQTLMYDGSARAYMGRMRKWGDDSCAWLKAGCSVLAPGGVFYIMFSDRDSFEMRLGMNEAALDVHECLIWLNSVWSMPERLYQTQNESVLYGWKSGASHKWYSDRKQTNILQYNNAFTGEAPVAMQIYLLRNSTERDDIIFDNLSTNGNTLIACEQTGRRCRMVIGEERVCDMVRKRWAEFTSGPGCNWATLTPAINKKR